MSLNPMIPIQPCRGRAVMNRSSSRHRDGGYARKLGPVRQLTASSTKGHVRVKDLDT